MTHHATVRRWAGLAEMVAVGALTAGFATSAVQPVAAAGAFQAGAAVSSITPYCGPDGSSAANNCVAPPPGFVDPASCVAPPGFSGRRLFAFEEPYIDQQASGHYDLGDPFVDCNGDTRWDGNLIGGGSNTPRFYDRVADPPGARAMVVANGSRTIAVEVLDHEGAFDTIIQAIRDQVGRLLPPGASLKPDDVFISSTHDESAPDSIGLYGVQDPNSTTGVQSSVNPYWVTFMEARAAEAVVSAYNALRPATIRFAEPIEPANMRQCFSSYPFIDDQLMPTLQAVDASTGTPIVTLTDVSQHTETLGFNGGADADPAAPVATTLQQEKTWLSADWPHWFRQKIERDGGGGVAIEMAGSVGSNETPEVFAQPISRTPQQFVDESHPAGCRTLYTTDQKRVPLGYYSETRQLGEQLAAATEAALALAVPSATSDITGARADVCVHDSNVLFAVGGAAGFFSSRPTYDDTCTVAFPPAPNGTVVGTAIKTQVAAFRIGDGTFVSIPGEVFPFTFLRGFVGPGDMPCPDPNANGSCGASTPTPFPLPAWLMPHMHTPFRFIDGLGEDMIGYIFPRGNGVGVPGEYPTTNPQANSGDRFGCGHSDDSEAASSQSGDLLGGVAAPLLDRLAGGATVEEMQRGRYVMPDGSYSRDPLGGPEVKCKVDQAFIPRGPAVGVVLAGGTRVTPTSWMSLSGRPQSIPDRNTRGYFDARGTRNWLDVFDDVTSAAGGSPPPTVSPAPSPVPLPTTAPGGSLAAAMVVTLAGLWPLGVLRRRRRSYEAGLDGSTTTRSPKHRR